MPISVTITIRAVVQVNAGREQEVARRVTSEPDDGPEDLAKTITLALRQINEEVKGLLP